MKIFAERLRKLRKEMNLTQQELSDKLGDYSKPTIASWENDRRNPDIEAILTLSRFFNVDTTYLVGDNTTEMTNEEANEVMWDVSTLYKKICKDVKKLNAEECFAVYDYMQAILKKHTAAEDEKSKRAVHRDKD